MNLNLVKFGALLVPDFVKRWHTQALDSRHKDEPSYIERRYLESGLRFQEHLSEPQSAADVWGRTVKFLRALNEWLVWERRYADLGYRTIPTASFARAKARGIDISPLIRQARRPGEQPHLWAFDASVPWTADPNSFIPRSRPIASGDADCDDELPVPCVH